MSLVEVIRMTARIIIVTGIPGSGKTTILQEVAKNFPKLEIINYGDAMLEEASFNGIERDTLRKLAFEKQQEIGLRAAEKIALQSKGVTIIDTHAFIKTPLGYVPGVPYNILQILQPKALVMIECEASLIHERRKHDMTRSRDVDSIEEIEYHQSLNRSFMTACSALTQALLLPLHNKALPKDSIQPFIQLIKTFHNLD